MTGAAFDTFLEYATEPVIVTGFVQIAIATVLTAIVLGVVYLRQLGFEREVIVTAVRGFVHVVAAGTVIGILLAASPPWTGVALTFMTVVAAAITYKRTNDR